ncbi:MAG TPA: tetratricopeptide repeat protein, partial [Gemmatimonadaceae bacterium]|nr:tetratricopeptide repeat protein [Gemmatimonadaceae bacterium]
PPTPESCMRNRPCSFIAVVASAFLLPLAARAQTDTALRFTTSVPRAATELKAGITDMENFSLEAAAARFESATNADPSFGLARVLYAGTTTKLTPAQRTAELNRGVADAARASTTELLLAAAYREFFLNRDEAAAALFRAAASLIPGDRYLAFAGVLSATPPGTAVPSLREFISRHPDYAPPYNNLAYALWAQGDRAGALEAAKRQVELNPNAPNPHDTYAELLQWNGNFAEATAAYRRAAATAPRFPEAHAGLAEVDALQGRYDQARAHLNQAIANAYTPQQKLTYMRAIAGTYALQGADDAVARQYEAIAREATAQQNASLTALANAQLAAVYGAGGKAAESHRALAAAKAASPEVPWVVHYYGVVAHGQMKHWGPATEELNALKAKRAANLAVSPTLVAAAEGFLLTQQGRPAEALRVLSAADTTSALIMNRIAEAHAALGHAPVAADWNARIGRNYVLNLVDIPAAHARRRARGGR